MTIEMEKAWNILSIILAILAVLVLIGQIIAGSGLGIFSFIIIVKIIIDARRGENAYNG